MDIISDAANDLNFVSLYHSGGFLYITDGI